MSDRGVIDSRALGSTKGSEFIRVEVRPIVRDDVVRDTISEYQFPDETHSYTCFKVFNGLGSKADSRKGGRYGEARFELW